MRRDRRLRLALAAAIIVALVLFAGALLAVADTVLSIVERLREGPAPIYYGFIAALSLGGAIAAWLLWWLLAPPRRSANWRNWRVAAKAGSCSSHCSAPPAPARVRWWLRWYPGRNRKSR